MTHKRLFLRFVCMLIFVGMQADDLRDIKREAHQAIKQGNMQQAADLFGQAHAIDPDDMAVWYNMAYCLVRCNRYTQAVQWYQKVLERNPDDEMATFGLAKALLALGDYERGLLLFEWRYGSCQAMHKRYKVFNLTPASFAGKEVVLISEWGIGDMIMSLRYVQQVKEAGATRILVQTSSALVPLLSLCPYIDQVITPETWVPAHTIDVPLFCLPRIFGTTPETIPTPIPYLYADEVLRAQWHAICAELKGYKIGICWSSNKINRSAPACVRRTIPLATFDLLSTLPDVTLVSLQKGDGEHELATCADRYVVFNHLDDEHGAFMDTVALMKELDLIITADTSIAHIAGALGCQTWVLLPYAADWRWFLERSDSPWYPTVRLFRQQTPGDWDGVMKEVYDAFMIEFAKA